MGLETFCLIIHKYFNLIGGITDEDTERYRGGYAIE